MPAYNADAVSMVILVDDGSTDATLDIARQLGLEIFVHNRNYGYGANQKTCYAEALRAGADIVVMVHPDYQYDPRLVRRSSTRSSVGRPTSCSARDSRAVRRWPRGCPGGSISRTASSRTSRTGCSVCRSPSFTRATAPSAGRCWSP